MWRKGIQPNNLLLNFVGERIVLNKENCFANSSRGASHRSTRRQINIEHEREEGIEEIEFQISGRFLGNELKRVGLFGTGFTMQGRFYSNELDKAGITLILPASEEQAYIHDKYMSELVNGIFLPETREGLLSIVCRLRDEERIDGLILGGTELPLIMRDAGNQGIPFLDTTKLHVESVISTLLP